MRTEIVTRLLAPALVCAAPAWAVDYLSVPQAQAALFSNRCSFAAAHVTLTAAQRKAIKQDSGVAQRSETQAVWRVFRDEKPAGWFLVDQVIGKHEYITYALALTDDGRVLGLEILSYHETHGGQVREETWRRNFVGKTLADPFTLGGDVPNIAGATLSCRNVMNGVKRLLALHRIALAHA